MVIGPEYVWDWAGRHGNRANLCAGVSEGTGPGCVWEWVDGHGNKASVCVGLGK